MAEQPQFVDLTAQMAPPTTLLPPDPPDSVAELQAALATGQDGTPERLSALRDVARRWPASVATWAALAESALALGQDVEAYAFARTAYHRGLDRLRANGGRGAGLVPGAHAPNLAVLRALRALMLASERVGEADEVQRLRTFLLDSDPSDPLGVRDA